MQRRRGDEGARFRQRKSDALNEEPLGRPAESRWATRRTPRHSERLDRARSLDELPFAARAANPRPLWGIGAEEGALDGFEIGRAADDDEDRDGEGLRELVDVDDVEAAHGDALEHDGTDVPAKLASLDELDHFSGRVRAVTADAAAHHSVQSLAGAHGADEQHVAAVRVLEWAVVETDDVHEF
jgi:hypothetical protein